VIGSLEIKNFKCFKDAAIPFNNLTVISGCNGVGKSSIIQSLLLLRQTSDQLRLLEDFTGTGATGDVAFPIRLNEAYHLSLGNSIVVTNSDLESGTMSFGVSSLDKERSAPVTEFFEADTVTPATTITCHHQASGSSVMLERRNGLSLFSSDFHYLIAERLGPRDLYGVSDADFISTGFAGEFTAHAIYEAEKRLATVQPSLRFSDASNLFKVQLEAWMSRLVPGIRISTHSYPEINKVRISIERVAHSSQPMSPMNTGFGISYSLPIIVSGLLAAPGSMMIVENPEAHLHPSAQSVIGEFLACVASAGVQVVVETHSENVINGVRLAAAAGAVPHADVTFLFLSLNGQTTEPEVKAISVDQSAELTSWPLGFFDQQGRDLARLMNLRISKRATPTQEAPE